MKALVCVSPRQLAYREVPPPVPEAGRAILKIRRIGICGTDLHAFEGTQPYFQYPRILGHELAGEVAEIRGDSPCKTGEEVTFIPYAACGRCVACRNGKTNACVHLQVFGVHIDGGMREYVSVPVQALVPGQGLGLDALALVEPLAIGAHAVRRAAVREGELVLVMGAGPIGLGVMEFARLAGANVIALDIAESRLAFCRNALGVTHTINPTADNVPGMLQAITGGDYPTVVFDATGNAAAITNGFSYIAHGGRYVLVGLQKGEIRFSHPEFHKREATLMSSRNATSEDFAQVIRAIQAGAVNPLHYITHRQLFEGLKDALPQWLDPQAGVIKAMVELPG